MKTALYKKERERVPLPTCPGTHRIQWTNRLYKILDAAVINGRRDGFNNPRDSFDSFINSAGGFPLNPQRSFCRDPVFVAASRSK